MFCDRSMAHKWGRNNLDDIKQVAIYNSVHTNLIVLSKTSKIIVFFEYKMCGESFHNSFHEPEKPL